MRSVFKGLPFYKDKDGMLVADSFDNVTEELIMNYGVECRPDYKVLSISRYGKKLQAAISELENPAKLIRLCCTTLSDSKDSVKFGQKLCEPFETKGGFRQGDIISCDLFNILLEIIMRQAASSTNKTISSKSLIMLAYADDVDIREQTIREVTAVFSKIEKDAAKAGLVVNESKTKLMVSMSKASTGLYQSLNVDNRGRG